MTAFNPLRNFGLKAISVAIALLLWLAVTGEQVVERSLVVPLELQNKPEQLELIGVPPTTVDVRVRGTSSVLGRLTPTDVIAVVDLSTARPGRRYFHLSAEQIQVPPFGVEVSQVSPPTLALEFEPAEVRVIPVVANLEGRPAQGFVVEHVKVDPPAVQVAGPETAVRALQQVLTEPVSLAGLSRSLKETATIGLQTPGVRLTSARTAVVSVTIGEAPVEHTLEDVPVRMRNVPAGRSATVSPAALTVVARGPKAAFGSSGAEPIVAYVDLNGLGPGRHNLRVLVDRAPKVDLVRIKPAVVRVALR